MVAHSLIKNPLKILLTVIFIPLPLCMGPNQVVQDVPADDSFSNDPTGQKADSMLRMPSSKSGLFFWAGNIFHSGNNTELL